MKHCPMTHCPLYKPCLCAALLCAALLYSSVVFAQGVNKPASMTSIPGGFFIEWASPVEIAAIRLDRRWGGPLEVMFDVPSAAFITEIDSGQPPVASPEMITVLADYWIVRGKPERAIPLYQDSLARADLDDVRAFVFQNNLAMLYSQVLGEHNKALEVVDSALATRRDNATLLNTKGLILINAGNSAEAIPILQRAVELSCQLPLYCMHLAYALHQEGRPPSQSRRYFDVARDRLILLAPSMTNENKAMFDTLQLALPPVGSHIQ